MSLWSVSTSTYLPSLASRASSIWTWVLACLFLVLGCIFTTLIPPFQVPDENAHWYAAYQRTEMLFHPFAPPIEHCLYANTLPDHFETGRIAFNREAKIDGATFGSLSKMQRTCMNFVLTYGYVGTYPGVIAARIIAQKENQRADKTFQVFILSRLLQGLLVFGSFARLLFLIKKSRALVPGIATLSSLLLSPLLIQQSFAISADTIMLALSLYLIIAMLFWSRLTLFDYTAIALLAVSNGLTKPPQIGVIPAALLAGWMISRSQECGNKRSRIWISVAIFVTTLACSVWMTLQDHRPPAHQVMGRDLDIGRQVSHVLANPWATLTLFHQTLISYLDLNLLSGPLGWLDAPLREWTRGYWKYFLRVGYYIDLALLLAVLLMPKQKSSTVSQQIWSASGFLAMLAAAYISAILIICTLYITWTPVGALGVQGLQGRYFLPLLMLAPIAIGGAVRSAKHSSLSNLGEENSSHNKLVNLLGVFFLLYCGSLGLQYLSTIFTDLIRRWW